MKKIINGKKYDSEIEEYQSLLNKLKDYCLDKYGDLKTEEYDCCICFAHGIEEKDYARELFLIDSYENKKDFGFGDDMNYNCKNCLHYMIFAISTQERQETILTSLRQTLQNYKDEENERNSN